MKKVTEFRMSPSMPTWESLEEFARLRMQEFLQGILEEEVTELLGRGRYERREGVDVPPAYRNGYGKPRKLSMKCGTIEVQRPRVRGLEGRFESRILPMFVRRTEAIGELLPELYLHGLSQGDFALALRGLLGDGAPLSPSSIERLRAKFQVEYEQWLVRSLSDRELVYAWADGIYVRAGLEKDKAALLVVIGAMRDGRKEVLAVVAGQRESKESWLGVLRDLKGRGLRPPKLLVGDGIPALWSALGEVWPETEGQRCWNHKIVNVLDQLPKRIQAEARSLLTEIPYAPTREEAEKRREALARKFGRSHPHAVEILRRDWDRMVTFFDFPEPHWRHLRTTNIIESPFASVRLRTDAAKRYKNVGNATALIWRVLMVAERRFRRLNAPDLLGAVFSGAEFLNGQPLTQANRKAA